MTFRRGGVLGAVNLRRHARPLVAYAVLSISTSVYQSFDSVLLGMLNANNAQVALYQLAARLKGMCGMVSGAIVGVLIPRLSYYVKNDPGKYDVLLRRGFGFVANLCVGIMAYLLIFAHPLVVLISSSKYSAAVVPVQIIGMVNFLSCMSYFFGLCILSPLDRERKLAGANLLGVPISIALNVALNGSLGAVGAALSVLAAEAAIFIKQAHDSRDVLQRVVDVRMLPRIAFSHLTAFAAAWAVMWALRRGGLDLLSASGAGIAVVAGFAVYSFVWLVVALLVRDETATWAIGIVGGVVRKVLR